MEHGRRRRRAVRPPGRRRRRGRKRHHRGAPGSAQGRRQHLADRRGHEPRRRRIPLRHVHDHRDRRRPAARRRRRRSRVPGAGGRGRLGHRRHRHRSAVRGELELGRLAGRRRRPPRRRLRHGRQRPVHLGGPDDHRRQRRADRHACPCPPRRAARSRSRASGSGDIDTSPSSAARAPARGRRSAATRRSGDGFGLALDTNGLADGSHELRARAIDATGNEGTSGPHSLSVDNTPRRPRITQPTAGAIVGGPRRARRERRRRAPRASPRSTYLTRPAGGSGVDRRGERVGLAVERDAGTRRRRRRPVRAARAVTDAAGNIGVSAPISVTVDSTAPTVAIGTIAGRDLRQRAAERRGLRRRAQQRHLRAARERRLVGRDRLRLLVAVLAHVQHGVDRRRRLRHPRRSSATRSGTRTRACARACASTTRRPPLVSSVPGRRRDGRSGREGRADRQRAARRHRRDGRRASRSRSTIDGATATISGTLGAGPHVVEGQLRDLGGRGGSFRVELHGASGEGGNGGGDERAGRGGRRAQHPGQRRRLVDLGRRRRDGHRPGGRVSRGRGRHARRPDRDGLRHAASATGSLNGGPSGT